MTVCSVAVQGRDCVKGMCLSVEAGVRSSCTVTSEADAADGAGGGEHTACGQHLRVWAPLPRVLCSDPQ